MIPEDIFSIRWIQDPQVSPNGDLLAFSIVEFLLDENCSRENIRLMTIEGDMYRDLAIGEATSRCPRWSPDGKYLAFISDQKKKGEFQLYVLQPNEDEARPVTDFEAGIGSFQWLPDGKRIALLKGIEGQNIREKDIIVVDQEEVPFQHLCIIDIATRQVQQLTLGGFHILEFKWSPSGDQFVVVTAPTPIPEDALLGHKAGLKLVSLKDGDVRDLNTHGCPTSATWSPDGKMIAFLDRGNKLGWPDSLFVTSVEEGIPHNLTEGYEGTVLWADWISNEELLLLVCEDVHSRIRLLDIDTGDMKKVMDESTYNSISPRQISLDRKRSFFVFTAETTTSPPDIWAMDLKHGSLKQLTGMNPQVNGMRLGKVDIIRWYSSDKTKISGILIKPVRYNPEKRYPLIVLPHGGPLSSWQVRWSDTVYSWGQLLSEEGFLVLLPNPRGGLGRGSEFIDASIGDIGGKELDDILSGVDFLIRQGSVDPERIGIGGVSHGGYLAALAIARTKLFKAAVVESGIVNWISHYAQTDVNTGMIRYLGGTPWDNFEFYLRRSPITYAGQIQTPTLIIHGEEDKRVHIAQSWELYRALKGQGVPCEFVIYKKEGHGIIAPKDQLDLMKRVLEWFKRWLKS